jgi:hypothetical protein
MEAAGYTFSAPSGFNENALRRGGGDDIDFTWLAEVDVYSYYTDPGVAGRWHRLNLFDPNMKEVGAGIANGTSGWIPYAISVINCAYAGTGSFLTGVAYADTSGNNRYTPGEQRGGVNIVAIRSDGAEFTTTTWESGGYTLSLPAGTYTVWGGGGMLGGWVKYDSVTVGAENVKRDFRPDYVNSQSGPGGTPDPHPGDADGDGDVDVNDLGIFASNWQQSPRTFAEGDFDHNGIVDVNDLGILASNWQTTSGTSPPAGSSARSGLISSLGEIEAVGESKVTGQVTAD